MSGAYLLVLLLALFCAVVTGASAYMAGATLKALLVRMVSSAVFAGVAGFVLWSWLRHKVLGNSEAAGSEQVVKGGTVDIEVADEADAEEVVWQPMPTTEINENEARIFPARSNKS